MLPVLYATLFQYQICLQALCKSRANMSGLLLPQQQSHKDKKTHLANPGLLRWMTWLSLCHPAASNCQTWAGATAPGVWVVVFTGRAPSDKLLGTTHCVRSFYILHHRPLFAKPFHCIRPCQNDCSCWDLEFCIPLYCQQKKKIVAGSDSSLSQNNNTCHCPLCFNSTLTIFNIWQWTLSSIFACFCLNCLLKKFGPVLGSGA